MNLQTALGQAIIKLKKSSSPALDAEVLLAHVLKKDRTYLFANPKRKLTKLQATTCKLLIEKRLNHWPIAYLTGHKGFFGLDFIVTPDVLIPRPETETLVELAIQNTNYRIPTTIIDVGTGSGNIIISLAKSLPSVILRSEATKNLTTSRKRSFAVAQDDTEVQFFAIDSSPGALKIARRNARRYGVSHKIKFLRGNLLSPFLQATGYKLQPTLIIANLPYLPPKQYSSNPDLKHEPRSALVGGPDGLKYFRELFHQLSVILRSEATKNLRASKKRSFASPLARTQDDGRIILLLEHDPAQEKKLKILARKKILPSQIKSFRDLSGRRRFIAIVTRLRNLAQGISSL